MADETFTGRLDKVEIGEAAGVNVDIENCILFNWERMHDVQPRLYANTKTPTEYQQSHSWIVGSFSLLSDNHAALYDTDVNVADEHALDPDGDSGVIDWFTVFYRDKDDDVWTTEFTRAIIYKWRKELLNFEDSVWVYSFMAAYAEDSD